MEHVHTTQLQHVQKCHHKTSLTEKLNYVSALQRTDKSNKIVGGLHLYKLLDYDYTEVGLLE